MFNFNAETFVIFYPYAAGGRFLQMAMSLDPTITAIHTSSFSQPQHQQLFAEYRHHLETTDQNNAHYKDGGHLPEYKAENIPHADRYVFCIHQVELAPALEFLRKCQNLKIFIIDTSTEESFKQLSSRRWFFAQRVILPLQDGYKLHAYELQTIRSFNQTCKLRIGKWPVGSIELEDYWSPTKAVPLITDFFTTHNVQSPRWEELYHLWHNRAIKATLNETPSNS